MEEKSYLNILEKDLDFDKIKSVLRKAPQNFGYLPDSNGFYIRNRDIELRHVLNAYNCRGGLTGLWFHSMNPKIYFSGPIASRISGFSCDYIASQRDGSTRTFAFSLDGTIGNTIGIHYRPFEEIGELGGPEEWFLEGSRIVNETMDKYDYFGFVKKYEFQNKKNKRENLIERMKRFISDWSD